MRRDLCCKGGKRWRAIERFLNPDKIRERGKQSTSSPIE
jgi:hypothetical protein